MKIKGFIFDLDGVLTDSAEYHYLAWKNLGEKLGISIDREFNETLKGISRLESLNKILEYGEKDKDYTEEEKQKLSDQKNEEYVQLIQQVTDKDLLPGILELLQSLKDNNIRIGLASASQNGPFLLEKLGISDFFDVVVDPTILKNGKPDPEIFLTAAEKLGLKASECVGVEDAAAGVDAINSADMFSVGVGTAQALPYANYRVDTTVELDLVSILEKFNK